MSLRFYLGASGSGKSKQLHKDLVQMSMEQPMRNHLLLVPDQFTMQTQKDICNAHPNKGILNIDVLSFSRLSHRIFEEVGIESKGMLDDTGKNLIIRRIAQEKKSELKVMHRNVSKIGYIHEIKSCISEFMQYAVTSEKMDALIAYAKGKDLLTQKLEDLRLIYAAFREALGEKYTTSEESYHVLKSVIKDSDILKDSVIVLDGFTGFTPLQVLVIEELLRYAKEVIVSITIDSKEDCYSVGGEQGLFFLSQNTISVLEQAYENVYGAKRDRSHDVLLEGNPVARYEDNLELAFLEQSLFRYDQVRYEHKNDSLFLTQCANMEEEIRNVVITITKLIRERGYRYGDFAVVTGNLELYAHYIKREFDKYEIPYFLDATKGIQLNPCIEFVKSALEATLQGYRYEGMFHYLRSGMCDYAREEIDQLEQYVIARGIQGIRKWKMEWQPSNKDDFKEVTLVKRLNEVRSDIVETLSPFSVKTRTVKEFTKVLYDFIIDASLEEKTKEFEVQFQMENDLSRAKEYSQIYKHLMDLLDQFMVLMPEEEMTLEEYAQILYAGLEEIQIGFIPQGRDQVVVGDIERTRLKEVKTLFFVGINDGIIPKSTGNGGIISDFEREFLQGSSIEMAPTPRQQIYQQRLYLYMNMTKPTHSLRLSYAKVDGEGKSLRPAYLVWNLRQLFPKLVIETFDAKTIESYLATKESGLNYLSNQLRNYALHQGLFSNEKEKEEFYTAFGWYYRNGEWKAKVEKLIQAAFYKYENHALSSAVAEILYGSILQNSVSRLEQYASCAYSHFLKYGLELQERNEYSLEKVDLGTIFHGVLEEFGKVLEKSEYTWFDFSEQVGNELIEKVVKEYCSSYGNDLFASSARYEYGITRITRIMQRTVGSLQYQLKRGAFQPAEFELSFQHIEDMKEIDLSLEHGQKMQLRGRIDRLDTCENGDQIYVKVIDYKSSEHDFNLVTLYHGLQLQLVVYLNAAVSYVKQIHPDKETIPGAILYYHMNDPMIDTKGQAMSQAQIKEQILEKLQMKGIVNADRTIIGKLDDIGEGKSHVIPVGYKKDGDFTSASNVLGDEHLKEVSQYVSTKMATIGREILEGNMKINPYKMEKKSSCDYCKYKGICKYDGKIDGFHMRNIEKESDEDILRKIGEENGI